VVVERPAQSPAAPDRLSRAGRWRRYRLARLGLRTERAEHLEPAWLTAFQTGLETALVAVVSPDTQAWSGTHSGHISSAGASVASRTAGNRAAPVLPSTGASANTRISDPKTCLGKDRLFAGLSCRRRDSNPRHADYDSGIWRLVTLVEPNQAGKRGIRAARIAEVGPRFGPQSLLRLGCRQRNPSACGNRSPRLLKRLRALEPSAFCMASGH